MSGDTNDGIGLIDWIAAGAQLAADFERLRAEVVRLQGLKHENERLRRDNTELHRLRAEVDELKSVNQLLRQERALLAAGVEENGST